MLKRLGITCLRFVVGLFVCPLFACTTTTDSLGYNSIAVPSRLQAIECPEAPPNYFQAVLAVTQSQTDAKLAQAINTLYHGNPEHQRIYFTSDDFFTTEPSKRVCDFSSADDKTACIRDILHGDIRTEGLGLGMLVAVMLDRQDEFDRLWRYAKAKHQVKSGPTQGFFSSACDISLTEKRPCYDPYGLEQFLMAMLVAHLRWGSTDTAHPNHEAEALGIFSLLRHKVIDNGGIVGGVTNSFDSDAKLMYDAPDNGGQRFQRTALSIPGYFDIWAMATGDSFYSEAATAARSFLVSAADPGTGLYPIAANFDGSPVEGYEHFAAESFRVHLNLVIDRLWGKPNATDAGYQDEIISRILTFFRQQGIGFYGSDYSLDGKTKYVADHASELVMANAVIAAVSNAPDKKAYVQAAWDLPPPEYEARYYSGIIYLVSNLILAGQFKLCQ